MVRAVLTYNIHKNELLEIWQLMLVVHHWKDNIYKMNLTPEETEKLKATAMYLVKKRHNESHGKCGFALIELREIFEGLIEDGKIIKRPAIHGNIYFLNTKEQ